jgi:hypothetical protein
MKCEEFQSQFSDVLDNRLEAAAAKALDEHLAACFHCREELVGLLECRRLVASLPEVEPPSGFVTRVMAHVHDSARRATYWERLLLPLQIKIPLHATAVILIAVMSVYVYQKEDRQNAPLPTVASDSTSVPQPGPVEDSGTTVRSDEIRNEEKPVQSARKTTRGSQPLRRAEPAPAQTAIERSPETTKEARRSVPIPAQGVAAGIGPSGPAAFREPGLRGFPGAREFSTLGEPVADYELFVRRRPNQEGGRESEAPATRPETDNSSTAAETKTRPEKQSGSIIDVLWYTIPQDRYEQFKKELSGQATIESENVIGAKDKQSSFRSDGPFYVKVIVLSP